MAGASETTHDLLAMAAINQVFDTCSQLAIRSIYLANQVVHPGPAYLRDLIIEFAHPPAVNQPALKLFCLDATHATLSEQTMIDRIACSVHDEGGQRLFQLVAGGREELTVACRSLKLETLA